MDKYLKSRGLDGLADEAELATEEQRPVTAKEVYDRGARDAGQFDFAHWKPVRSTTFIKELRELAEFHAEMGLDETKMTIEYLDSEPQGHGAVRLSFEGQWPPVNDQDSGQGPVLSILFPEGSDQPAPEPLCFVRRR